MGSADPSQSGVDKHKGTAAGGRPGPAPSRGGRVRASEGTNPCTRPSFATKNVFDVLQDLSESIGGSPGPQLDAADGQPEPIVHDLHQSLVELLERPEILSLHAVRRVGRERQLHLKVRALCGEVEKVFDVLVDTGAQVSLVKAGLLPPECLTDSRKPVRLKVANGQYMVGGTKEAAIGLQFVNHRELSRPDLGKEILLHGRFHEAEMDWDMIVGYDFMMETDSGVLLKVLPWVVVGAGGLGAGKTSGAGTRGVSLDVVIGGRTGHSDTNGGESSDNRSKVHADCGPAENPSL